MPGMTPSQTVGPYFAMRLPWPDGPFVVPEATPGAITIIGRLYDGAGNVIPDGLIETWQAGPDGRFAHPDDPRGPAPGRVGVRPRPARPRGHPDVLPRRGGRQRGGSGAVLDPRAEAAGDADRGARAGRR